jgi:hypothetical protein
MEVALVNAMSRETILRQYLDTVKQNYDFILLDCMPSLGMLTVMRCSCRQCADTGSGSIPSCKGSGTAAWNHQQGQETNQPETED